MGTGNVLIDFYYARKLDTARPAIESSQKGFERFFKKHANWGEHELVLFQERTGKSWWETEHQKAFLDDWQIVKKIIDNFFAENILKVQHLQWLQNLGQYFSPHLVEKPTFDRRTGENINLDSHSLVQVYYNTVHQLPLQSIYQAFYEELLKMLRREKTGIKKCPSCEKLFEPTPRGHNQIYCSAKCKMRYYRKHKENY